MIFTAASVINALGRPARGLGPVPPVSPFYAVPDLRYQVHSVLQLVPPHLDVRLCDFSQRVERGLKMAFTETRRRALQPGTVTMQVRDWGVERGVGGRNSHSPVRKSVLRHQLCVLQLLNITTSVSRPPEQRTTVDIAFAVRDGRDYLPGSEVSEHLRKLSLVEFSFYVGFPALQIAERTSLMRQYGCGS